MAPRRGAFFMGSPRSRRPWCWASDGQELAKKIQIKIKQNIHLPREGARNDQEGRGVEAAAAAPPPHHVGAVSPSPCHRRGAELPPLPSLSPGSVRRSSTGVGSRLRLGDPAYTSTVGERRSGAAVRPRDASRQENLRCFQSSPADPLPFEHINRQTMKRVKMNPASPFQGPSFRPSLSLPARS